jgi:hypothetical protein
MPGKLRLTLLPARINGGAADPIGYNLSTSLARLRRLGWHGIGAQAALQCKEGCVQIGDGGVDSKLHP